MAIGVPNKIMTESSNMDITPYHEAIGHKLLDDLRLRLDKSFKQESVSKDLPKEHLKLVKRTTQMNERTPTST